MAAVYPFSIGHLQQNNELCYKASIISASFQQNDNDFSLLNWPSIHQGSTQHSTIELRWELCSMNVRGRQFAGSEWCYKLSINWIPIKTTCEFISVQCSLFLPKTKHIYVYKAKNIRFLSLNNWQSIKSFGEINKSLICNSRKKSWLCITATQGGGAYRGGCMCKDLAQILIILLHNELLSVVFTDFLWGFMCLHVWYKQGDRQTICWQIFFFKHHGVTAVQSNCTGVCWH